MKSISFIFAYLFLTCGLSALDFQETKKLAEGGSGLAQYSLGVMYANGDGVPQDYKEAMKWYRKSADQGNANAQFSLGVMYDKGEGVPQDYKEAVRWYRMSAEQGKAIAQRNLGLMYFQGVGVIEDYITSYAWISVAKANGHEKAAGGLDLVRKYMSKDQIAEGQKLAREIFNRTEANRKD
jgi:TPR repeat protein